MTILQRSASGRRRARRRRRRRQRRFRRPRACRKVARRPCRAGSRSPTTCEGPRGTHRSIRGGRRTTAAAAGVMQPTPLGAGAATAARPAAGASARICERAGRGAIVLSRAAVGSLAGGVQAAQKHRAQAAAEAHGVWGDGKNASKRRWRGAAHVIKLSSMPDLPLDRELRTCRSICTCQAHHFESRPSAPRPALFPGRAGVERARNFPLLQMVDRACVQCDEAFRRKREHALLQVQRPRVRERAAGGCALQVCPAVPGADEGCLRRNMSGASA